MQGSPPPRGKRGGPPADQGQEQEQPPEALPEITASGGVILQSGKAGS